MWDLSLSRWNGSRSVAAAAPALAAPRETMPGPPGRPVAVGRCLVEAARADRLAHELRHVDAVVADDRGVGPGVGALHVVFAEDPRRLHELARRLAAEGLGFGDDAGRKRLCGAADGKVLSDGVGKINGVRRPRARGEETDDDDEHSDLPVRSIGQ